MPMSDLRDPAADEDRVQKAETLVLIGVCTRTPPPLSLEPNGPPWISPVATRWSDPVPPLTAPATCSRASQTLAACPSTEPATLAAGSAHATALTMTHRDALERAQPL